MSQIRTLDEECGYAAFRDKYLAFPPTASLPAPEDLPSIDNHTCVGIYYDVFNAVSLTNPCFDIYQVATTCPVLWDVLGCKSNQNPSPGWCEMPQICCDGCMPRHPIHAC